MSQHAFLDHVMLNLYLALWCIDSLKGEAESNRSHTCCPLLCLLDSDEHYPISSTMNINCRFDFHGCRGFQICGGQSAYSTGCWTRSYNCCGTTVQHLIIHYKPTPNSSTLTQDDKLMFSWLKGLMQYWLVPPIQKVTCYIAWSQQKWCPSTWSVSVGLHKRSALRMTQLLLWPKVPAIWPCCLSSYLLNQMNQSRWNMS
jgi:hypothetical protein